MSTCGTGQSELEIRSQARSARQFLGAARFSSRLGNTERATLSKAATDYLAHNHARGAQGAQSGERSPRGHARVSGAAIGSTLEENDRGVNWPAASSSRCGQGDSGATRSESQPL